MTGYMEFCRNGKPIFQNLKIMQVEMVKRLSPRDKIAITRCWTTDPEITVASLAGIYRVSATTIRAALSSRLSATERKAIIRNKRDNQEKEVTEPSKQHARPLPTALEYREIAQIRRLTETWAGIQHSEKAGKQTSEARKTRKRLRSVAEDRKAPEMNVYNDI